MSSTVRNVLIGFLVALVLLLAIGAYFIYQDNLALNEQITQATSQASSQPTSAPTTDLPSPVSTLPPPMIAQLPTATPSPTPIPTDTPIPTETPIPTATPTVQPTNTKVPVVVAPTSIPLPTAIPATATPANIRGLTATFSLEAGSGATFNPGEQIWFNFVVFNAGTNAVPFGFLGILPRKDGQDRFDLLHDSWTNSEIGPNGLSAGRNWRDHVRELTQSGSYTLRLAICFDADAGTCRSGGGSWHSLSGEIPVTIR